MHPSDLADDTYATTAPDGTPVTIPARFSPQEDPYPALGDLPRIRQYFEQEGYVVLRNAVPPEICSKAVKGFEREIKPRRGYFIRHASTRPERHVFTEYGFMKYPIMNVQDLPQSRFPRFRQHGLEILTHPNLTQVLRGLFGEEGKLTHTMFFDGNQVTWAHQDTYYIDSAQVGSMIGVWVAAEDIQPGAGRFFVYPRSHRLPLRVLGKDFDLDPNGDAYKAYVLQLIRDHGLRCRAPALRQGDAILFSSRTIHGSLPTTQPYFSRKSFTAHYIPMSHGLRWFHTRDVDLPSRVINGVNVLHHHDRNVLKHRLGFWLRTECAPLYRLARRLRSTP